MATLRFHHELYSTVALDEAVRVFAEHATIERREDGTYEEVALSAADNETELVGEFGNYVLALTIDQNRA